eukprot:9543778-Lingulodinium_polyedra.AAC.1
MGPPPCLARPLCWHGDACPWWRAGKCFFAHAEPWQPCAAPPGPTVAPEASEPRAAPWAFE